LAIKITSSLSLSATFDYYFAVCTTDLSCLVSLPTEDGGLYHIVADASFTLEDGTQIVYFYARLDLNMLNTFGNKNNFFVEFISDFLRFIL
jgi:hypothetical protein